MESLKQELNERMPMHLVDELLTIPLELKKLEEKLIGLNLKISERRKQVEIWELEEMRKVAESEEEGKKKYPNKEIRDAEIEKRMRNSREYQTLMQELMEAENEEKKERIEFNYNERKFKSMGKIADLLSRRW